MKTSRAVRILFMGLGMIALLAISQLVIGNASAPPAAKTGAPNENRCNQCHGGTAGTGSVSMIFGNNETAYVPGQQYAISVNVTDATKTRFGFQVTALAGGVGATVGTFAVINSANTSSQTATITGNQRRYMAHKAANSNQNWTFNWTAPATDVGPITFFLVGLGANNNNNDTGDKLYSTTFTINPVPPAAPNAAFTALDTTVCVGANVTLNDLSSNSPNSHAWFFPGGNPSSSSNANPVVTYAAAGSYDVTLIVGNVTGFDTLTLSNYIQVFDAPSLNATSTLVACAGGDNGAIDLTPTGAGGYTYLWSNGATVEDPSGLSAGIYTVTVTDGNGCTNTASFTVQEPSPIALSFTSQDATCGNSDGSATVAATGGTGAYTYLWSTGATTTSASGLAAGTYEVTVSDANGCFELGTVSVSNLGAPAGQINQTNVTCNGEQNASIDLTISGGQGPFTYQWSNGSVTEDISGLSAGTYTVTVTSIDGCVLSEVVEILEPAILSNTLSSTPELSGNDGSASVSTSGGNGGYTYLWSNGQTGATITGLNAGTYTVTVTDSLGCSLVSEVNVSLVISVSGPLTQDPFTVGPNPFHEYFVLTPNVTLYGKFVIHLVDIEGRIVYGSSVDGKGAAPIRINPGPLPDGVYMLMIKTAKGQMHRKMIHAER